LSLEFVPLLLRAYVLSLTSVRPESGHWEYYRSLLLAIPTSMARRHIVTPNDLLRTEVIVRFRGHRYLVTPATVFAYYLFPFEPGTAHHLLSRSGEVFVDAGANVGQYTVPLASRFSRVLAVEPNPMARSLLERNLALNAVQNVRVVPYALAATPGRLRLYRGDFLSTWSLRDNGQESVEVQAVTLRTLLEEFARVDVMKVDIEEAEREMILHSGEALGKVREMNFEIDLGEDEHRTPPESQEVFDFLIALGFQVRTLRSPFRERENTLAVRPEGALPA
jgi:FkbM family methyltransferase